MTEDDYDDEDLDEIEDDVDLAPLVEATVALHEVYLALIDGGFDDGAALRLIAYLIAEQGLAE